MHYLRRLFMDKIEIGVYYYIDESGNKVYDFEAMSEEFEGKLSELTECVVMCSIKETDNG